MTYLIAQRSIKSNTCLAEAQGAAQSYFATRRRAVYGSIHDRCEHTATAQMMTKTTTIGPLRSLPSLLLPHPPLSSPPSAAMMTARATVFLGHGRLTDGPPIELVPYLLNEKAIAATKA
jgi:hypothetical protein